MQKRITNLKKEDFKSIFSLFKKQPNLRDKEVELKELIAFCDNKIEKKLLINLLSRFYLIDIKSLNSYLSRIAKFIIFDSTFDEKTTQISAITYDDEADSSQKILDFVKMPLFKEGWVNVKTVNRFGNIHKNFKKGRKQIIFVDEFVGSGMTILGRIKQLKSDIREDFELKLCFIAGMDYGLKKIEELGYEVFCPLRLQRGISEYFVGKDLESAEDTMLELELKLTENINNHQLFNYSFGYNDAEALYSSETCLGNTPNSVFPIFWWPKDKNINSRKTLLTRYERGLK